MAFTIAKVTQIDLLAEIQASLENAFVEGQSFESWRKELKPTLQKHGWLGQTSVVSPKTGEEKEIFVGAKRLKTIFYTNARTAYAQAEARAGYELKLSEYIRYVAILDNRVRAEHAALHGKIAHRKDKFWETNYPPNGWNCRCSVEFISKDEMDELGWTEMSDIEKSLNYAEKGWDKDTRGLENPTLYLQEIIKDKLKLYESKHLGGAVKALNAVKGELAFKTMFKGNGDYRNSKAYKDIKQKDTAANRRMRETKPRASSLSDAETNSNINSIKSQGDLGENSNIQKVADIETKIKELEIKRDEIWEGVKAEFGGYRVKEIDARGGHLVTDEIRALQKEQYEAIKSILNDDKIDFITKSAYEERFKELDKIYNPPTQEYKRDRREAYLDNERKKREAHAESVEKQAQNERDEITKKLNICKQAIANLPTNTAKEQAFVRMLNNEVAKAEKSMANAPRHFEKLQTPKNAIAKINDNFIRMADEDLKPITESVERYIKDNNLDEYGTANFKIGLRNYILQTKYLKKSDDEILASWGWDKESLDKFKGFLAENSSKATENPQKAQAVERIQQKFHKDEKYANDLYEWHKDSSPLTKDEDGTPKVFYHGSPNEFEVFDKNKISSGYGFWFSPNKEIPNDFKQRGNNKNGKIYKVFLKIKKPFDIEKIFKENNYKEFEAIFGKDEVYEKVYRDNAKIIEFENLAKKEYGADEIDFGSPHSGFSTFKNGEYDKFIPYNEAIKNPKIKAAMEKLENDGITEKKHFNIRGDVDYKNKALQKLRENGYDGIRLNEWEYIVFEPNQIKAVGNKGTFDTGNPNIFYSKEWIGGGLAGGTLNSFETDENGNVYFNPQGFLKGFVYGAAGTKAVKFALENPKIKAQAEKFATISRIKAKKENPMKYSTFKAIDESQKYGSKMKLIGKENLNADILAYSLAKGKRFAINKLDEQVAKVLEFKYPHDVRRTIQPDEVVHTLKRHGTTSNLATKSGQKPVTLDDIAKYQDYADSADKKGKNYDKQGNEVLVSFKRLDNDFYVVVEQIRRTQNELGYKDMYFGRGKFDESKLGKIISLPASS